MRISMCSIVFDILISLGYMMIFKKCGIKLFWAFIPFAREYQISRCSERENDGLVYAFFGGVELLMDILFSFLSDYSYLVAFLSIPYLAFVIGRIVYAIRIYTGLAEVFGRSKKWAFLFIFAESVAALIWGFSKSFQPVKELNLYDKEGAKVFGGEVKAEDEGLSVEAIPHKNGAETEDVVERKHREDVDFAWVHESVGLNRHVVGGDDLITDGSAGHDHNLDVAGGSAGAEHGFISPFW